MTMRLFRCTSTSSSASRASISALAAFYALSCASVVSNSSPAAPLLRFASSSSHTAVWKRVYQEMPTSWKTERPILVREVSDREMERIVAQAEGAQANSSDDESVVDGCYRNGGDSEDEPATITLRDSLRGDDVELVFAHEYGHSVWDEKLTGAQRSRYRRIWRAQKQAGHLVTRYARDSEEEGFAEAFSFFLRRSQVLRHRDPVSWQFLNGILPDDEKQSEDP